MQRGFGFVFNELILVHILFFHGLWLGSQLTHIYVRFCTTMERNVIQVGVTMCVMGYYTQLYS